jgi:hypothetical protein
MLIYPALHQLLAVQAVMKYLSSSTDVSTKALLLQNIILLALNSKFLLFYKRCPGYTGASLFIHHPYPFLF